MESMRNAVSQLKPGLLLGYGFEQGMVSGSCYGPQEPGPAAATPHRFVDMMREYPDHFSFLSTQQIESIRRKPKVSSNGSTTSSDRDIGEVLSAANGGGYPASELFAVLSSELGGSEVVEDPVLLVQELVAGEHLPPGDDTHLEVVVELHCLVVVDGVMGSPLVEASDAVVVDPEPVDVVEQGAFDPDPAGEDPSFWVEIRVDASGGEEAGAPIPHLPGRHDLNCSVDRGAEQSWKRPIHVPATSCSRALSSR